MSKQEALHVVLIPFLGFGHMIPFLELSIALARAGVRVSYISTPRNIERLPKIVPPDLSSLVRFVAFPFPGHPLLPPDAEATMEIPFHHLPYFLESYDRLRGPVRGFVAQTSPDWVVVDFCTHWAAEITEEFCIPLMFFSVFSAAFMALMGPPEYLDGPGRAAVRPDVGSLVGKPGWVDFPSSVGFRGFEAAGIFPAAYGGKDGNSGMSFCDRKAKVLRSCHAVAIRSCYELEGEYIRLYEKLLGKTVIPAGLLPPRDESDGAGHGATAWSECFEWLDRREPKSVVFVGFGSETQLSGEQIAEIAHGLQLSELPFLWALKNPCDERDLPPDFPESTCKRGKVCLGWSPQMKILAHPSIGASLFHSGWGSTIEALQFGHALAVLPFIYDQGPNARLLVDKGLAIEIERGEDGSFTRDDIAKSLRLVVVSDKLRARCRETAHYFGDRKLHQDHYIGDLVESLRTNGAKK